MIKAEHIPASMPVREADNIKKAPIQKVKTPQTKRQTAVDLAVKYIPMGKQKDMNIAKTAGLSKLPVK
ncbi:conserved domain protein [Paraprevotella xylaniphila YIT 11841]|uniref:Conserved domain protein n=1 Tax=Paraprevotella xylaniphila YIT 11841 TaxID=762982 RepID=F3QQK0_9BACT|nr:conserved domain protein [Paraprevotella xylaniphila YIT 11841]